MTVLVKFKCVDCGARFDQVTLTDREKREAERDRRPVFAIHCPKCGSQRIGRA